MHRPPARRVDLLRGAGAPPEGVHQKSRPAEATRASGSRGSTTDGSRKETCHAELGSSERPPAGTYKKPINDPETALEPPPRCPVASNGSPPRTQAMSDTSSRIWCCLVLSERRQCITRLGCSSGLPTFESSNFGAKAMVRSPHGNLFAFLAIPSRGKAVGSRVPSFAV